jgi:hypothetical protein
MICLLFYDLYFVRSCILYSLIVLMGCSMQLLFLCCDLYFSVVSLYCIHVPSSSFCKLLLLLEAVLSKDRHQLYEYNSFSLPLHNHCLLLPIVYSSFSSRPDMTVDERRVALEYATPEVGFIVYR